MVSCTLIIASMIKAIQGQIYLVYPPIVKMLKDGHPNILFAHHWCAPKWTITWIGNVGPDFVFKEPGVLRYKSNIFRKYKMIHSSERAL